MSDFVFDSAAFEKRLAEISRAHSLAIEDLTERQFIEAIRQAVAAGDFQRYVRQSDSAQQVTYIPFREVEQLKRHIAELEQVLKKNGVPASFWEVDAS